MKVTEAITSFFRKTDFQGWRDRQTTTIQSLIKTKESITSFFRKRGFQVWRRRQTATFVGKLDGNIVASQKPVIIFEYPHIRHAADNVEDATTFLVKVNECNQVNQAAVYRHDTDRWRKVDAARQ